MPTPLGNLGDITLRALEVLRSCDLIAAEDTRVARRLLAALQLPGKPIVSYREANAASMTPRILERARGGDVAVVCDAGTPGISDPGRELVAAAREASVPVLALPGPVAFVTAAVLSGFDLPGLTFEGFLPRTAAGRRAAFETALAASGPTVWYESPHRIVAALEVLASVDPEGDVFLARELTKLHEQQILGKPRDVIARLAEPVRGEIVLVLAPHPRAATAPDDADVDRTIDALLAEGLRPTEIAKRLAAQTGNDRAAAYGRVIARQRARIPGKPRR